MYILRSLGFSSFSSFFALPFSFLLLWLPFLHDLSMKFLDSMWDCIRQVKQKDDLVLLNLVEQSPGNAIRNPVIPEVIFGYGQVSHDNPQHFFLNFFFDCVTNFFLEAQNIFNLWRLRHHGIRTADCHWGPLCKSRWHHHNHRWRWQSIDESGGTFHGEQIPASGENFIAQQSRWLHG